MVLETILFYKIDNKQAHGYLTELIPTYNETYHTWPVANVPSLSFKHVFLKKHILPISYYRMKQARSLLSKFS